jgi:putative cell wall-binding protein/Tol biopolymer transport system component
MSRTPHMATGEQRGRREAVGLALVLLLVAALLVGTPGAARAVTVERVSGPDRFATAVEVSRDAFAQPDQVLRVHLATGLEFPDALAAGAAAADVDGPVLLTTRDSLPEVTRDELRRLQPQEVVLVGGQAAIGPEVEAAVADDPEIGASVRRVEGADRFATAAALARSAFFEGATSAYIATGEQFADALAGVPAAGEDGAPLLLVTASAVPQVTHDALRDLGVERAVVLGGQAAVSDAVLAELREVVADVQRIAGADRFATSAAVSATTREAADTVYVATGLDYPDALAGGPAAATVDGPLLLVHDQGVPPQVRAEIDRLEPVRIVVLGGPARIPESVMAELRGEDPRPPPPGDLAFDSVTNQHPRQHIAVATLPRSVTRLTEPPAGMADRHPTYSPDGRRIAFIRSSDSGNLTDELYVVDVAEGPGSVRALTATGEDARLRGCAIDEVSWSPDGRRVAFQCLRDTERPSRIGVVHVASGTLDLTPSGTANDLAPSFSPDGSELAFTRFDAGPRATVRIVPIDALDSAGRIVHETDSLMLDTAWSPDGTRIAVVDAGGVSRSQGRITVIPVDGSPVTTFLDGAFDAEDAAGPHHIEQWLADSQSLLVRTDRRGQSDQVNPRVRILAVGGGQAGTARTVVGPADLEGNSVQRASASPDGAQVVYDDLTFSGGRFVQGRLEVVGADGSGRQMVGVGPGNHANPTWNPARQR